MKHFRKRKGRDYSPTQKRPWLYGRQAFSQVFWRRKDAGLAAGEEENSLAASTRAMEAWGIDPTPSGVGRLGLRLLMAPGCSPSLRFAFGWPEHPTREIPMPCLLGTGRYRGTKGQPPNLSMGTILHPTSQRVRLRLVSAGFSILSHLPSLLSVNRRHLNLYLRPHF